MYRENDDGMVSEETIRQLQEENRRLKRQIRKLKAAKKKKVEFSKLIFVLVSVLALAVTVYSCAVIWVSGDTSALAYLIPAVFAELASATGFYYTKAKAENKIKLMAKGDSEPDGQGDV